MLIKYPSRGRPAIFRKTLDLYLADPLPRVLVTIDKDDETMNTPAMRDWLYCRDERVTVRWGKCKSKIEAVNDGVREMPFDLLILASDDMTPQRNDYAQRIVALFNKEFPEGDGVLHLNDGRAGKSLNTLCILDRKYFDRFGYIYHPQYQSLWADNEFQDVSEACGRARYVDEILIRHEWVDLTGKDALHLRNEQYFNADRIVYRKRRRAGFPTTELLWQSST